MPRAKADIHEEDTVREPQAMNVRHAARVSPDAPYSKCPRIMKGRPFGGKVSLVVTATEHTQQRSTHE